AEHVKKRASAPLLHNLESFGCVGERLTVERSIGRRRAHQCHLCKFTRSLVVNILRRSKKGCARFVRAKASRSNGFDCLKSITIRRDGVLSSLLRFLLVFLLRRLQ